MPAHSAAVPASLIITPQWLETTRSQPSEGLFSITPSITIVLLPPPSMFIASYAPSSPSSAAMPLIVLPTEIGVRPSTTTRYSVWPSSLIPTAVRGCRSVS